MHQLKPMSTQAQAAQRPTDSNGIQPVFVVTVDDPQRVGDPIRAYTMYTVHVKVGVYPTKKKSY